MMSIKYKKKEVEKFLRESNAIEGIFDEDSFKQAKLAWEYLSKQIDLTVDVILKTHKILLLHSNLMPDEKGYFRRVGVSVGGREGLYWRKIPEVIDEWLGDVATSVLIPGKDGEHIKLDHITYEEIHPFVDGNGRTGRMFMNWQRMMAGLPILIIHADWAMGEEGEQTAYYEWFK
jgi:Fic family protein